MSLRSLSSTLMLLALMAMSTGCDITIDGGTNGAGDETTNGMGDDMTSEFNDDGTGDDGTGDDGTGDDGSGDGGMGTVFAAQLSGDAEVPAVETDGTGSITATLSEDGTTLTYEITVTGMTGDATVMHFHLAPADESGGVVEDLSGSITNEGGGDMTASGTIEVDADFVENLETGLIYLNVHTAENPGGELRGQLGLESEM